ncbi:ATP-binding protein [Acinetobacter baumannii]
MVELGLPDSRVCPLGFTRPQPDHNLEPRRDGVGSGRPRLGLAIAKALVEAHGGQIAAQNREGGGAIFTVRLPG